VVEAPVKLKNAVAYIRESSEEQGKGYSPETQLKSIEDYAQKNNYELTGVYTDLISGRLASKRTEFQKMIEDAMQKKFDAILIFHSSRFARNVAEAKHYKELLRKKQNIDIISISQQFGNYNEPSSFVNESVNEIFDEYYSRQLSFWVRSALMTKRAKGKPIGGTPPYGYYRKRTGYDKNRKRPMYSEEWHIDEKKAKLIKRFFKMYSTGNYSLEQIATIFTRERNKTNYGNDWTYSTLKCTLQNKSYYGMVYSPRKDLPDLPSQLHKPIISKELFDKCQDVLRARKHTCGRPVAQHRFYLLQGLLYCHHCFERLQKTKPAEKQIRPMQPNMYCETHKWTGGEKLFYACKFKRENDSCSQPMVNCEDLDKQIIDFMCGFNLPDDVIVKTVEKLGEKFEEFRADKRQDDEVGKLLSRRKKLKFLFLNGDMTENEYLVDRQKIDAEIERLKRQGIIQNMTKRVEMDFMHKTEKFLKNFPAFWNSVADKKEQREWIKLTLRKIWVKNNRVVGVEPRDEYKALFCSHKKVISQSPVVAPLEIFC
jgi:site-specific DNA recombinase